MSAAKLFQPEEWRHLLFGLLALLALAGLMLMVSRKENAPVQPHASQDKLLLWAEFERTDGIDIGSPVKMAGIAIGEVVKMELDHSSLRPKLLLAFSKSIDIPSDSSLKIISSGLFGQRYLLLSAGGAIDNMQQGDGFSYTQGSILFDKILAGVIDRAEHNLAQRKSKPAP